MSLSAKARFPHKLAVCEKTGSGHYHYKNWSFDFECPTCARRVRVSLNYLGQRKVLCNGLKSIKVGDTIGDIKQAGLDLREAFAAFEEQQKRHEVREARHDQFMAKIRT